MKHPPFLPTWLLNQLGCSPDTEAVLGDLAERYRQGETWVWYWKQTLIAIVISACEDIRGRKLLALRTVLVAALIGACIEVLVSRHLESVTYLVPQKWWNVTVFRTGFELLVSLTVVFFQGIVGGWITVRLYGRRKAALLLYMFVVQVFAIPGILAMVRTEALPWFAFYLAADVTLIVGMLAGGNLAAGPNRAADFRKGEVR
jgi:hypothetical protein